jgi:hypothetical protein
MKGHFVLDENIIILAQKQEDQYGQRDSACLELLRAIEENCHALVVAYSYWGKYESQLHALSRRGVPLTHEVIKLVKLLVTNAEKDTLFLQADQLKHIEGLDELIRVNPGDRDFVRAAASAPGSILVTTDGPLREEVEANDIDEEHGFSVLPPIKALELAKQPDL